MIIKKAEFIKSAAEEKGFIIPDRPMIAVCGKSNVGKSTFINMLANQKKLAKTSNSPGRTRLVNYFDFGEFLLADLPGYGYAMVSKTEKERWSRTLETFFDRKQDIAHVFALVDIRHSPTLEDMQMLHYLYAHAIPYTIVSTKADKLGKSKIKPRVSELAKELKVVVSEIIATSSETRYGKELVLDKIEQVIKVYYENIEIAKQDEIDEDNNANVKPEDIDETHR